MPFLDITRFSSDTFSFQLDFSLKNINFILKLIYTKFKGKQLVVVRLVGNIFQLQKSWKWLGGSWPLLTLFFKPHYFLTHIQIIKILSLALSFSTSSYTPKIQSTHFEFVSYCSKMMILMKIYLTITTRNRSRFRVRIQLICVRTDQTLLFSIVVLEFLFQ